MGIRDVAIGVALSLSVVALALSLVAIVLLFISDAAHAPLEPGSSLEELAETESQNQTGPRAGTRNQRDQWSSIDLQDEIGLREHFAQADVCLTLINSIGMSIEGEVLRQLLEFWDDADCEEYLESVAQ
jgi:hypothetical protein